MINVNQKLRYCIFTNFLLLIFMATPIIILNDNTSKYFRWGWNDDLILISIPINTQSRYLCTILFISIIKISHVIIGEIANPIIGFNIYNPDKKEISDFTKIELQIYGNIMYLIDGFKSILTVMLSITQVDIALISMLVSEITSIFTINMLLSEKRFIKNTTDYTELEELIVEN